MRPPTMRELVEDPVYRTYLKKVPTLPENLRWGFPWRLWVERDTEHWLTRKYSNYKTAWIKAVAILRETDANDVCMVSARWFFPPPISHTKRVRNKRTKQVLALDVPWTPEPPYEWCWRCRRPSTFTMLPDDHHVFRFQPDNFIRTHDSPYRCFFCGIRRIAMPSIKVHNG